MKFVFREVGVGFKQIRGSVVVVRGYVQNLVISVENSVRCIFSLHFYKRDGRILHECSFQRKLARLD